MALQHRPGWASWAFELIAEINGAAIRPAENPVRLKSYAKADLPAASDWPAGTVYVSDETGGATLAFSDGTDWRRVQDRAVVS